MLRGFVRVTLLTLYFASSCSIRSCNAGCVFFMAVGLNFGIPREVGVCLERVISSLITSNSLPERGEGCSVCGRFSSKDFGFCRVVGALTPRDSVSGLGGLTIVLGCGVEGVTNSPTG